ncbi:TPA: hypothetical protein CPT87_02905 [Candidatus Gastranaerophilales bacterium HUM_5]|jgi:hypothetical protein|nr:MAG TPA: hypothetical protein CPT99_00090 [Candidatus Gastranaerophilales bacterium HUM_4]DAA92191.1 MAG TPA: hypothetical protein CPT87_02905 [Candidatus Gastranaerophilales bacterium HUM_5]DAB13900.1 MAG TPA: hypothetical protein CPT97_09060 [Candidatus Gastranaerophilales bacterium HUM_17]DAB17812.1 MAG TPA: hypothetical protein CPT98_05235 [Candidatus Gastranaerophilales bacterium HUM_19]
MVDVSSRNNRINVNVSSAGNKYSVDFGTCQEYYDGAAKEWAISDKLVQGIDYSSKYYAGKSKELAQYALQYKNDAQEIADTAETNINSLTSKFNSLYSEKSEALQSEYSTYSSSLEAAKTSALTSIKTTGTDAYTSVTTASTTALSDITNAKNTAVSSINGLSSDFISLYTKKSEALSNEYSGYSNNLETAANSAVTNIQAVGTEAYTSITTSGTASLSDITAAKNIAVEDIQNEAETQISNIQSTGFYMRDGKLYYTDREGQEQEFKSGGDGLPLLSIRHALYVNEALGLDYYLNGQLLTINKNLQGAAAALISLQTTTPSLFTTEQSWQAEKEASDYGQVGKFVLNYDDVADKYHAVGYDRYIFEVSLYKTTDTINSYRTAFCIHKLKDNIEVGDIGYLFDTATGEENQNITFTVTQVEADAGTENAFFRLGGTVSGYPDYDPPGSGIESALDGTDIAANNNNSPVLQILKGPTYTKSRSGEGKNFCIPDTTIGAVCYEVPYPSSPNSFTAIPHLLTHFEFVDGGILGDSSYSIGIDNEEILTDYGLYPTQPVYHYTPSTKVLISMRLPAVVNVQGVLNLQNAGLTIKAELPNIIGTFRGGNTISGTALTGAFYNAGSAGDSKSYNASAGREYYELYAGFNASLSSPKYKDGATVQEEAIQYPYVIRLATGQETEVNITNEIELNNPYTLFDSKYSPAQLFNVSWLKSDGEYKPKATYVKAYEALLVESNTEVKAGTSVILPSGTIYVKHGLSVKLSTEEYTDYDFVINTSDETFRLPLKNGTEGMFGSGAVIGNGISLGFTNGSKNAGIVFGVGDSSIQAPVLLSGSAYGTAVGSIHNGGSTGFSNGNAVSVVTDPTKSGLVVANAGVVPDGWTLYYYIGETVQNANLIDAGRMQEQITNINAPSRGYLVESYVNNKSWYRIYSDGWCEQGGQITVTEAATNITLLKSYKDNNYNAVGCQANINTAGYHTINVGQYNATQIQIRQNVVGTPLVNWIAMGYIK